MLSEEIGLNERLEADGVEVFETDLGEFILQLAGEPPEHILAPAIHWSRERVRKLFEPLAGRPLGDDPDGAGRRSPAATCGPGSNRPASASPA